MTKEELEKEAEQYAVENWEHYEEGQTDYKALKQAYLDSAEPREKRIAELSKHIVELQEDKGELTDKVKELEAQIEKMKRCSNCTNGKCGCKYRTIFTTVCDKWELRND